MGTKDELRQKVEEAEAFETLKIKLGGPDDKSMVDFLRSITDKPFMVDANQGWKDLKHTLNMLDHLASRSVLLVEQPLPVLTSSEVWMKLKRQSPLPIFADESVKRLSDLDQIADLFHGVNIKLMKSTGLAEAHAMLLKCKELGLQTMVGCMSESSCAIMAAAQLSPLADFVDLDGPFLVTNDPFESPVLENGRIELKTCAGHGAIPISGLYPLAKDS
jgi:L-alanine-DL-glutamate epimerase-like enolase superfamily enzyme